MWWLTHKPPHYRLTTVFGLFFILLAQLLTCHSMLQTTGIKPSLLLCLLTPLSSIPSMLPQLWIHLQHFLPASLAQDTTPSPSVSCLTLTTSRSLPGYRPLHEFSPEHIPVCLCFTNYHSLIDPEECAKIHPRCFCPQSSLTSLKLLKIKLVLPIVACCILFWAWLGYKPEPFLLEIMLLFNKIYHDLVLLVDLIIMVKLSGNVI